MLLLTLRNEVAFHVLKQGGGEDEIIQVLVVACGDFLACAFPCFATFVDEDDVLTYTQHRVHVVGVDDSSHALFVGDVAEQLIDNK